jgi:GT2 family glycosyltransferase
MTLDAVESFYRFGPPVKEFVLLSNNSTAEELQTVRDYAETKSNITVVVYDKPFNYQKINNFAVRHSSGKFLFLLNNDTEMTEQSVGLVEKMYQKASEPDVGMVGCLLLYGDRKTIQHAGVYLRPGLHGDHLYIGQLHKNALKYAGTERFPYDIRESRPMTAVTGAAQIVERKKFDDVSGFDERFIICGGDVDLCLRLNKKGYQTWFVGGGYIVHKESQSRAFKPVPYMDFYHSYESYIQGYDPKVGDPFLPKITEKMR